MALQLVCNVEAEARLTSATSEASSDATDVHGPRLHQRLTQGKDWAQSLVFLIFSL